MSVADSIRVAMHKKKFEVFFDEGIPNREYERRMKRIYPEELMNKKCGGCIRFKKRDHSYKGKPAEGYHCTRLYYEVDISPDDKACVDYWDRVEDEHLKKLHDDDVENRRKELWTIYAEREPVKLPLVFDGCGKIPQCPVCGEMPYSTEQCHWCGQRFIQDKEIIEYSTPDEGVMDCPHCLSKGAFKYIKSKYNGHKSGECNVCGVRIVE